MAQRICLWTRTYIQDVPVSSRLRETLAQDVEDREGPDLDSLHWTVPGRNPLHAIPYYHRGQVSTLLHPTSAGILVPTCARHNRSFSPELLSVTTVISNTAYLIPSHLCFFCRAMICINLSYAVAQYPSGCLYLSHSCVLSKRINISPKFFHDVVATPF